MNTTPTPVVQTRGDAIVASAAGSSSPQDLMNATSSPNGTRQLRNSFDVIPSETLLNNVPDNQELYCKLLLSNVLAGSLIGKNGITISNIRSKSGANIRISNCTNIYSPDRLALISGTKESMSIALEQVVSLGSQPYGDTLNGSENSVLMKLVIPKTSVSLLIGKGGQRINEIRHSTRSKIHVSTSNESNSHTVDRIVKVFGNDLNCISAALLAVVVAIQSDSQVKDTHTFAAETNPVGLMMNNGSPLASQHYPSVPMSQLSPYPSSGPNGMMSNTFNMHAPGNDYVRLYGMEHWMLDRNCELFMQVPDVYVGILVGKNGQHITDIKQSTNTKVEISKKGDFVEGTMDRLVTISGPIVSCHAAHARLVKRVLELQQADGSRKEGADRYHPRSEMEPVEPYYGYN
eukprot:GHVH01004284.1.p1 GENE.GHVH01004284.1~~GHVH01004284.1.p1  ORF type:complete len:404 (+),score=38.34 GHVH01004284.1:114-1325(+)